MPVAYVNHMLHRRYHTVVVQVQLGALICIVSLTFSVGRVLSRLLANGFAPAKYAVPFGCGEFKQEGFGSLLKPCPKYLLT